MSSGNRVVPTLVPLLDSPYFVITFTHIKNLNSYFSHIGEIFRKKTSYLLTSSSMYCV